MKNFNLLIAFLFIVTASVSGQLNVKGYIFEQKDENYVTKVPFASIYYYNYEDSTKIEYFAVTNIIGEYALYDMKTGKYRVKIVAPGYQTKRQKIQFYDAEQLAINNNNLVSLHVAMLKNEESVFSPAVYSSKDILASSNDNLNTFIESAREKTKQSENTKKKRKYRVLLGGMDISPEMYRELNKVSFGEIAQVFGDNSLRNTYLEYYDLSIIEGTLVDEIYNIVFNDQSRRPDEKSDFIPEETVDFLIEN
jgi:hypothetical protein